MRDRLIELIQNADNDKNLGWYDLYDLCRGKGCAEYFADYLIANGATVQEWISVKDRLPEVGEAVLVFRDGGFAISEIYMIDYEGNQMWSYIGLGGDPTHWMPLPPAPKGE